MLPFNSELLHNVSETLTGQLVVREVQELLEVKLARLLGVRYGKELFEVFFFDKESILLEHIVDFLHVEGLTAVVVEVVEDILNVAVLLELLLGLLVLGLGGGDVPLAHPPDGLVGQQLGLSKRKSLLPCFFLFHI